ncbi:MAG TPA: aminotransferase class I/II-fold pyridoxal phosphate-dependent enzyme [Actinomycetes bacterium]|nr:aminotransferase class I/II-fold pyridoxal phosphate-dependent enzyme [Actinomycetes bacterium]
MIDFRPGVPELAAFPRAAWATALRRAVLGAPTAALGYGDPAGAGELRAALAGYLGRVRGVEAAAAGVLVTAGFAQAVALLARGLPSRLGRAVAVEDPGSPGTREQLAGNGLEPVPVGVDEEGLRVDELARGPARVVVVTPAHQSPTGVVLSPDRRAALLAWARAADGLVIEDDYDAEYRYDRDPVGALQGLPPSWCATPGRSARRWPRRCASAGWCRRDRCGRRWPGPRPPTTSGAPRWSSSPWPTCSAPAPTTATCAAAGPATAGGATPWRFGGRGAPGLVLGYASLTEHQIAEGVRRVAPLLTGRR